MAKNTELTDRQWINQDSGSASPREYTWEQIFDAYKDYVNSRQWN